MCVCVWDIENMSNSSFTYLYSYWIALLSDLLQQDTLSCKTKYGYFRKWSTFQQKDSATFSRTARWTCRSNAGGLRQTANSSVSSQELACMSVGGCIRDQTCLVCKHHKHKANLCAHASSLQRILECSLQITWRVYLWNSDTWQPTGM